MKVIGDAVDVQDRAAYIGWIDSAAQRLGGLDIFISNATASPSHAGEEGWKLGFEIDVMGAVRGCETALPYLRKSNRAAIVLIASISGVMSKQLPAPGGIAYGATKAALISYGAQLSKAVAPDGIRVNIVSPGPIYFEGVRQKASYITPVPGGVGPMTVTMLLFNTISSAERAACGRAAVEMI